MVEVRHWYETKSFNEGQIIKALCGPSPLHETKSSDKGQIIETPGGQSPSLVRDKVLQQGAEH